MPTVLEFDSRARLDAFVEALQRWWTGTTSCAPAMAWEGLREPVQVVWRHAALPVEEVELDPHGADPVDQLLAAGRPVDGPAPGAAVGCTWPPSRRTDRWLALVRMHHMVQDHTALEVLLEEVQAFLAGRAAELPEPLPFRNFVAQARAGGEP